MRNTFIPIRGTSLIFFLFVGCLQLCAQTGIVKGLIKGPNDKPLQYANVLLLKSGDSSLIKGTISDSLGHYQFERLYPGEYLVSASFAGMLLEFTKVIRISAGNEEFDQGILYLKSADAQLKEVTVVVKKPMFEQKADRTIINVRNSITSAGGTALEVLEKSPGVTVNRQNNSIAINGKNGVSVMLNGKISYMPADALVQMLAGISAGNIEKIELITTPPSKYDAEGSAGYINIVLINNPYAGFNGSYFLSAGFGFRELGSAGINFNFRSSRLNIYGNYSVNYEHTLQPSSAFTEFKKGVNTFTHVSFSDRDATRAIHNARVGIDYQLDTATVVGALLSGYNSRWYMIARNGTTISKNNVMDSTVTTLDHPEINLWQNILTNINIQHTFKPGKILYFDANYIYYRDYNPNTYSTDYYSSNAFLYHEEVKSGKITPINFKVFSSDYKTPIGKIAGLEAGAKLSLSHFTNDVTSDNLKQGVWVRDSSLSAKFLLKELVAAAYTTFNIRVNSKTSIAAGLRYEYTTSNLSSTETDNLIDKKYGELFPTFNFSRKLDEDNSVNFSYSRRITRPAFNDLAPFTIFFDPKTYYSGNPALQPAIANSVQASYVFRNYNFSISYTREVNTIDNFYFQVQRFDTVTNIVYLSARNFRYERYLAASVSLPFTINRWWTMQNNINCDLRQISTSFGDEPVLLRNFDYNFNSTQRFTLPREFTLEITGFYTSPSFYGTAKGKAMYQLNAGVQKRLKNKKDQLRLIANDIFNSGSNYRFGETIPGTGAYVSRTFNFQLVAYKIAYTHNFGNRALQDKRARSTGAEDEIKRVQN